MESSGSQLSSDVLPGSTLAPDVIDVTSADWENSLHPPLPSPFPLVTVIILNNPGRLLNELFRNIAEITSSVFLVAFAGEAVSPIGDGWDGSFPIQESIQRTWQDLH